MVRASVAELLGCIASAAALLALVLHADADLPLAPPSLALAEDAVRLASTPERAVSREAVPSIGELAGLPAPRICRRTRASRPRLPNLEAAAEALGRGSLNAASVEVAVSEVDPARIAIRAEQAIVVSTDGGRHFARIVEREDGEVTGLAFDCAGNLAFRVDQALWIWTGRALRRLAIGGDFAVVRGDGPYLAIVRDTALWVTADLGETWNVHVVPEGVHATRTLAGAIRLGVPPELEAPWPAIHADGMISRIGDGSSRPWLAVPGPERDGEIMNQVAIDAAERVWVITYHGGGSCDGSEELQVLAR